MSVESPVSPKAALAPSKHSPRIWVTFRSYSGTDVGPGSVIFEYVTEANREFSRVVPTSPDGTFTTDVQCTLKVGEEHTFILHKLDTAVKRSLKIDDRRFSVKKRGKSLIHFTLDLHSILQAISVSPHGKVTRTIRSADGYSVSFDAAWTDQSLEDVDDVSSVSSFYDDKYQQEGMLSLPEGRGEDSTSSKSSLGSRQDSRKALRVRFDKDIHEIPTTQQLQEEIQQAVEERAKLSKSVGDLSMQMFQMKHDMRDIKEALRQVTDMFAMESRKHDIRNGKAEREKSAKRRRVVLDGNGIAKAYGNGTFRADGIEISVEYYVGRDISVVAVISESKFLELAEGVQNGRGLHDQERLKDLMDRGLLSMTPSHTKRCLYILKYALDHDADVVSNDSFRSVVDGQAAKPERKKLRSFVESHRIPFTFIGDRFVPTPESTELSSSSHSKRSVERCDTL